MFVGVAVATAAIGVGSGVAVAVWSASGSGSGAGAGAVAQSLTITPQTPANGSLYPGGPAGPVFFTVNNPNPYAVTITGVAWGSPTSTNTASCASSNISIDANAPTTVSISVPANTTTSLLSINGVLDLSHSAPPGCQAVAFDTTMTVTGTQQ
ncbi:MAG TPA: hypothetical protein VK277_07235 [Acidimicrobiales bacterium]|nr:hypothetical protein [Acidimicrobiales bacterium]